MTSMVWDQISGFFIIIIVYSNTHNNVYTHNNVNADHHLFYLTLLT